MPARRVNRGFRYVSSAKISFLMSVWAKGSLKILSRIVISAEPHATATLIVKMMAAICCLSSARLARRSIKAAVVSCVAKRVSCRKKSNDVVAPGVKMATKSLINPAVV